MEIRKEAVRMFIISLNYPVKKIIGEIIDDTPELIDEADGITVLTIASEFIRVKLPVICEEVYSSDGKSGVAYLSTLPSIDEILEFSKSQILILPFTPTDDYLNAYMDMAKLLTYPIEDKSSRTLNIWSKAG